MKFAHNYGSPWWFAQTKDGGVVYGICEYRTGLYRIYSSRTLGDLQTGDGYLEDTYTSIKAAKQDVEHRISQLQL